MEKHFIKKGEKELCYHVNGQNLVLRIKKGEEETVFEIGENEKGENEITELSDFISRNFKK
jgi:hypothetical protein